MTLVPCHSRREVGPASRAGPGDVPRHLQHAQPIYFCAHPQHHSTDNAVTGEICRICPLWRLPAPESFRPLPTGPWPRPPGNCRHLGDFKELRECPSCPGTVRIKVFACSHPAHQETTLLECAQCPDFEVQGSYAEGVKDQSPG